MAFSRAKTIMQNASGLTAAKLLLAAARQNRKWLDGIAMGALGLMSKDGDLPYSYTCFGARRKAFLRLPHVDSDLESALELAVGDCYRLARLPDPDLIIDGGANTGMFSLAAAARWPKAKIVALEPVPDNIATVHKHLALNGLEGRVEVQEAALGGEVGSLDFYVREANQGSFDGSLPYQSVIKVALRPLRDVLAGRTYQRLLIKLDIEGAERDVLRAYFQDGAPRNVIVVMEVHDIPYNKSFVEELAAKNNLALEFFALGPATGLCQLTSPGFN